MSQSKKMSMIESISNIAVGMLVALLSQIVLFKMYGIPVKLHQNIEIMLWFTAISFARSYCLRRIFNRIKS